PEEPASDLHHSPILGGQSIIDGRLGTADTSAIVDSALRLALSKDYTIPRGQRRADALVTVCAFYLDNQQTQLGGRHRPHVNVIVDERDLHEARGELVEQQATLSRAATSRMLCDCNLHRIVVRRDKGRTT